MNEWKNNLRKIKPYVPGEQSREQDIVKLNANENPYPPSPKAIEAIKSYDAESLKKYPPSDAAQLKAAIAKHYGVGIENVFLGNGSDDVLALAFQAFFNSDKPIAYPDITYSFYPVWCEMFQIPCKTYPLDGDFRINPEDYREENGGVVIPNPNAPTSIGEGVDFIEKILEYNRDSVVIIDEAYADFGVQSAALFVDSDKYNNLLVTGTFSKSRSLAGMRIGFALGSAELISVLEAVKNSYNSYTVDSLSIAAGTASVEDEEYFGKVIDKIIKTRTRLTDELRTLGFTVADSSANFIFCTHGIFAAKDIFEYLKSKKVFVRYFSLPRIDNYLRITVGTDEEIDILLNEIKSYIKENS